MRSPQRIGVELPRSASGTRQRTFSVRLHLKGRAFSGETPSNEGPRQLGQSAALSEAPIQGMTQAVRLVMNLAGDTRRFLLRQLPAAIVLHKYFQVPDAIRFALGRLHIDQARENRYLSVDADVRTASGERFVMGRTLRHIGDIFRLRLALAVSMRIDKLIGEVALESGLVLFDRSLPPAFGGLADTVGRVHGEKGSGAGNHQREYSFHHYFSLLPQDFQRHLNHSPGLGGADLTETRR